MHLLLSRLVSQEDRDKALQSEIDEIAQRNEQLRESIAALGEQAKEKRALAEQEKQQAASRRSLIKNGDRSEKIRTYYFNHDYVVDHRIGMTVNRTANVLNGDLSVLTEALRLADKTERLHDSERK